MAADTAAASPSALTTLNSKRWNSLRHLLERPGPFCKADFTASSENIEFLQTVCKILVIGMHGQN